MIISPSQLPVNVAPFFPAATQPEIAPIQAAQIKKLLGRPIAYRREFATITGSVKAAIFLSQALYWTEIQDRDKPECDGWFYKSMDDWFAETGLTRSEQETVRECLTKRGLMDEALAGQPATVHFRLNKDAIFAALQELKSAKIKRARRLSSCEKLASRSVKNPQTEMQEIFNQYVGFPQTLIETETTKETTQRPQQQRAPKIETPAQLEPCSVVAHSVNETVPTVANTQWPPMEPNGPQENPLLAQLQAIGVSPKIATELVNECNATTIEAQLKCLDAREPRNRAATLVESIRENWEVPAVYQAQHEAVQQATNERARRMQDETRQAKQKAAEQARRAQDEAEVARLDKLWLGLDATSRADFEKEAARRLPPFEFLRTEIAHQRMCRTLLKQWLETGTLGESSGAI